MKKVLFLLLILLSVLAFSCKTEDDNTEMTPDEKKQICILMSGVKFENYDDFVNSKNNWQEPLNYSYSYEYSSGGVIDPCFGIVDVIVENGIVKKSEVTTPNERYLKNKDKVPVLTSISDIYEYCMASYNEAQQKKYTHSSSFECTLEGSANGKYPLHYCATSSDWVLILSIPSGSLTGPLPSSPCFHITITNFQIN
ncbi:MAG: hypothetical protein II098_06190 [Treponema sp.]|nr:hypothetical protein [Treponema sp.]